MSDVVEKKRKYLEQGLVTSFLALVKRSEKFSVARMINTRSRDTKDHADIEYIASNGEYLVIEAKSNETQDAPNTVHKVFGQLLKECSKSQRRETADPALAILIPDDMPTDPKAPKEKGGDYYRRRFREILPEKYLGFGTLVGAKYVFLCSRGHYVKVYTWEGFYNGEAPIDEITPKRPIKAQK